MPSTLPTAGHATPNFGSTSVRVSVVATNPPSARYPTRVRSTRLVVARYIIHMSQTHRYRPPNT